MGIKRYHIGNRLSETAIFNQTVYLAGQVAKEPHGDITEQARDVLKQLESKLVEADSSKERLLFVQIFLAHISDYDAFNAEWEKWVAEGNTPPRAIFEAKLTRPEYLVEITAIAAQIV